jgi:hypothetical protein
MPGLPITPRFSPGSLSYGITPYLHGVPHTETLATTSDCQNIIQPVPFLSTPEPTVIPLISHGSSRKRKNKENISINDTPDPPPKRRKSPKSIAQKLEIVFSTITNDASWTFSEFLYHVFQWQDENGKEISRSRSHAHCVQRFLGGTSLHTPGQIIELWMTSKDGRIGRDVDAFSTSTPYTEIKSVRACLTSFAAQTVRKEVIREAESAVHPTSGLHTSISSKAGERKPQWTDIGVTTVPDVSEVIKRHQPLTWSLIASIAARKQRSHNGNVAVRKRRPVEGVSVSAVISEQTLTRSCFIRYAHMRLPPSISPAIARPISSQLREAFCTLPSLLRLRCLATSVALGTCRLTAPSTIHLVVSRIRKLQELRRRVAIPQSGELSDLIMCKTTYYSEICALAANIQ